MNSVRDAIVNIHRGRIGHPDELSTLRLREELQRVAVNLYCTAPDDDLADGLAHLIRLIKRAEAALSPEAAACEHDYAFVSDLVFKKLSPEEIRTLREELDDYWFEKYWR